MKKIDKIFKLNLKNTILDLVFITIGIVSAGFGLKGFLLPNSFIDGGAMGVSLLIAEKTIIPLAVLVIVVNLPFFLIGIKTVGKTLATKGIISVAGLALCLAFIPYPVITEDKLLISVFGGFFLGIGIGLSIRGGSVIDGTEIMAIYLSKRLGMTIGDIIFVINVIIFSIAAYMLSVEVALYSILTYLSASRTVNFIIDGIEEYTGVTIISDYPEEIRDAIAYELGNGVTIYSGERGFGNNEISQEDKSIKIVYTVVTRLEINKLKAEIETIDPNAFIIMNRIKDTKGGMIKKKSRNVLK
jgi:uncharacterized membrane-anchored protein YitT (DUF2179 family)